jgi:DNA-binding FadR family transcriptional regulator
MSPEPVAAERAYRLLRERIILGEFHPGSPLNLQRLAEEFGISVSPLRDAMHRLVGERILEPLQPGGFQLPVPTTSCLHDLYSWHDQILRLSVTRRLNDDEKGMLPSVDDGQDEPDILARATTTLFTILSSVSGNGEFVEAIANASARLFRSRLAEPTFIKDISTELMSLVAISRNGDAATVRHAVWGYHRRRLRRVSKFVGEIMGH